MRKKYGKRFLFLLLFLGIYLFTFLSFSVKAEEERGEVYYKYYTSIRIEEGDTLWGLAREYGNEACQSVPSYIQEVKKMNHLTDDRIHAGRYLTVFYYSREVK
ncbi:MAG: LysM peptidoglycan-binding domain-containing protein [Lachnospiraceae bacterium]|nr:LysM peptidoglycan-binding domain-containing protein [Lachnospiraceae bacterium]